jgi:hypothetical protein
MKKQLLIGLIMFSVISLSYGQGIRPGIFGGINVQNLNGENPSGNKLKNDMIIGYHAGFNVLVPVAPDIYFEPGLIFSLKGADVNDLLVNVKYHINYLELPLNILYRGQLGDDFVLLGLGPYLGYALGGNLLLGNDVKRKIEFRNVVESGDPALVPYLRRFDAGANIFAGYEMDTGIFFRLNAQLGLLNINPEDRRDPGDEAIFKNTGFGLSVGYRF